MVLFFSARESRRDESRHPDKALRCTGVTRPKKIDCGQFRVCTRLLAPNTFGQFLGLCDTDEIAQAQPRADSSEVSEFGSRSSVSISSMAGESSGARRHGDQNCALRADVTSVRRATYRNHSSRVLRRRAVLDRCRFRTEATRVQGLLQFASKSRWCGRQNTGGTS